ncbi:GvpL/GvpF family gas vesicle protein [Fictibacillus sp. KU28468]|uniref:GvpL/GvpF family gas vesicle protein n=1 Tax=Fictibacillus sp. KU28468 TaxID=2991053 RepID=UPI00223CE575|nr:GvpL/GvpF family gas vesicle protein [Fictibacillus sp. KU28468]UZJ79589.1 GvpL/GvpF family gas vesicle protein [Fictibacillus sp. KU28468]
MAEKKGLYVFCIAQYKSSKSESIYFASRERELIFVPYQDMVLAAVEVPLNLRPSKENLLIHQKIIGSFLETSEAVFPFSFGHVVRSYQEAVSMLQRLYPQLKNMFPSIRGKIEVGLKVIGKKKWLLKKLGEAESGFHKRSISPKDRIKQGERAEQFFLTLRKEFDENLHKKLSSAADQSRLNSILTETMLLNASYLIKKEEEEAFDLLVDSLCEPWRDQADFVYTGPWPAYNFVEIRLQAEQSS